MDNPFPLWRATVGGLDYAFYDGACLNPLIARKNARPFWDEEDAYRFLNLAISGTGKTTEALRAVLSGIWDEELHAYSGDALLRRVAALMYGKRLIVLQVGPWQSLRLNDVIWFPPPSQVRIEPSVDSASKWLCRALKSQGSGFLPAYSYLVHARQLGLDKNDPNLIAAERYMEGYDGNYSKAWILLQDMAKKAGIHGGGSKPTDSEFITTWGFKGVEDKEANLPIGGAGATIKCVCNRYG